MFLRQRHLWLLVHVFNRFGSFEVFPLHSLLILLLLEFIHLLIDTWLSRFVNRGKSSQSRQITVTNLIGLLVDRDVNRQKFPFTIIWIQAFILVRQKLLLDI